MLCPKNKLAFKLNLLFIKCIKNQWSGHFVQNLMLARYRSALSVNKSGNLSLSNFILQESTIKIVIILVKKAYIKF